MIEKVPQEFRGKGFYSPYFLILKAKGGLRPILDLRDLNSYIKKVKFRMVSLATIIPSMEPGDWYAALNLKDAYFHISIIPSHRRFLSGHHYQFRVLPFGLSTAPRVFTKCMAVVAVFLCRCQVQVFPYLDDWLLKAESQTRVVQHISLVRDTFLRLGLILNEPKSILTPTQRIEFIGALLDSTVVRAFLPELHFKAIVDIIHTLLRFPTKLYGASGTYGCLHICGATCQRPLTSTSVASTGAQAGQGSIGLNSDPPPANTQLPPLVAPTLDGLCGSIFRKAPTADCPGYGRFGARLGSSSEQCQNPRPLVPDRAVAAHQCPRVESSSPAFQTFQSHLWDRCISALRQHCRNVLYKQTGWCSLLSPLLGSPCPVGFLHHTLHPPAGIIPSWGAERAGRPPQPLVPGTRVVPQIGYDALNFPEVELSP
ncbi:unnamed protein product [Natator depressus]